MSVTALSVESLTSIISLAFSCLYPRVIDFRGRWSGLHPYRPVAEEDRGSPSHLQMEELVLASILLSANEVTSHSFIGHIILWYRIMNRSCTTTPCTSQVDDLIRSLRGFAESCWRMVFTISLSNRLDVYCLPTRLMGWSTMLGMFSLPIMKMATSFHSPLRKERLLDFCGLKVISSSSLLRSSSLLGWKLPLPFATQLGWSAWSKQSSWGSVEV